MKDIGVEMEIWAFAVTPQAFVFGQSALERLRSAYHGVVIRLFRGIKPALPFSETFNAALLMWHMWRLGARPSFVRARTEHATMIAAIGKRIMKYRLIWDARGDTLSEFIEASRYLPWHLRCLIPLKIRAINNRLKMAQGHCDYAIFVSDALRGLQSGTLPLDHTLVLPCLADESLFYFDQKLREDTRSTLHYSDGDLVITYVGSTAIWQCVPETISLMEQAMRANPACKVLIVTPSRSAFAESFPNDLRHRVTITSGRLADMNRFLNAADIGLLLRKPNAINWVASPVKFAEYSLAGLPVITTEAIDQINTFSQHLGNKVTTRAVIDQHFNNIVTQCDRYAVAMKAKELVGSKAYIDTLARLYKGL